VWNGEAKRFGCLEIHHELELGDLFEGQLGRLGAYPTLGIGPAG
jgi:hypothetical protein